MTEDYNRVKEWILPLLDERGIQISQLAEECGVTRACIYSILQDKSRPSLKLMEKICTVLDRPLAEGLATFTQKQVGRPKSKV